MTINIYPLGRCSQAVQAAADVGASRIVYVDRKPVFEISWRDGQYWIRDFNAPRRDPFRPLCRDNLAYYVRELVFCLALETWGQPWGIK
jgi:hypothetical protein